MPLRATQRETCEGSSDNVVMPMEEFRKTIDGAIRIARNFDNGEERNEQLWIIVLVHF